MKAIIQKFSVAPRLFKQAFLVLLDLMAFPIILWLCYVIRLFDLGAKIIPGIDHGILLVTLIAILSLAITGVYRFIVRTFNEVFIVKLAIAVSLSMIALYTLSTCTQAYIPMSIPFMFGFMMFAWVWTSRACIRFIIKASFYSEIGRKRIAIYGAGDAGQQIAAALHRSDDHLPIFFIDDYASLQGQIVGGLKVYSVEKALQRFEKDRIEEILLALPSVGRVRKTEIIQQFESAHLKITELPGLTQLVDGEIKITDIQEVDIVDLLGRDPVPPISHLLAKNIQNKIVMVTGAGGSIGSELCRQIIKNNPKILVLYELTEFALYDIEKELRQTANCEIIPILGTVQDQQKLERIIEQYHIQTVYHAAAYKHVPLVECNPIAGLKNNAIGTANSLNAAVKNGVETFVLISTDKAVRPTNVMGASKRMAELYCQAVADTQPNTQISIVRFGNVLGSSGSVVPLFKQQIARGGPITVTHPDVTRYFMTIPEASQLVIQAGALGTGGDVFLLDMGEPVRIQDLARQMIKLSGLTVREAGSLDGDIEIAYSGLRPGEKLYEELLIDQENTEYTEHTRILRSFEKHYPLAEIQLIFDRINQMTAVEHDVDWALTQLEYYVDGYKRSDEVRVN
ncbi:polysaccharide biosynthesis protein [Acinetobacter sp. COS3]|uniref:polysaccharide biosynthesis protein n=1 Tax=Acinetobacter sp. COS3 TaxID=1397525 RepID=UPI0004CF6149|nr:nucleoside-diphosphate sugar epimerase/dehydratase [Acinetobacter sp. COS3]